MVASQIGLLLGLLALGLVALTLARQIGVLHERTAPVGGLLQKARGESAEAQGIDLDAVRVATAAGFAGPLRQLAQGRAIALLFVNEECAVCKSLLPGYEDALRRHQALPLVLVGGGASAALPDFAAGHGLRPERVAASSELAVALQVMQTPTLALLDPQGQLLERVRLRGAAQLAKVAERLAGAA